MNDVPTLLGSFWNPFGHGGKIIMVDGYQLPRLLWSLQFEI
jgi:hypothetical protein